MMSLIKKKKTTTYPSGHNEVVGGIEAPFGDAPGDQPQDDENSRYDGEYNGADEQGNLPCLDER